MNDKAISESVTFETEPAEASGGERFFHVRESDSYQLSFAHPLENLLFFREVIMLLSCFYSSS